MPSQLAAPLAPNGGGASCGGTAAANCSGVPNDEPHEGSTGAARQTSDVSTVTSVGSFVETSSDGGSSCHRPGSNEAVAWGDVKFASRIQPHRSVAHSPDDLHLLSCFLELAQLSDVEGDAVKLLLRVLRFLRLCDYSAEDICSILAHASAYFVDAYSLCGDQMDAKEVGNVLATLVFIAHCYVQDETCPLHVWHRHLFRKYCPLKTLNAAVVRLLEIRRYRLRLEPEDLDRRFACLLEVARRRGAAAPLDADTSGLGPVGEEASDASEGFENVGSDTADAQRGAGTGP